MTPSDVLLKAAELIERDGWWNGDSAGISDGTTCAYLAIGWVASDLNVRDAACMLFWRSLRLGIDTDIPTWNDAQPNGAVVCAALRAAAKAR